MKEMKNRVVKRNQSRLGEVGKGLLNLMLGRGSRVWVRVKLRQRRVTVDRRKSD